MQTRDFFPQENYMIPESGSFIIEDLIYIPTGEYQPVYTRPYVVNVHQEALDGLKNNLLDNSLATVTPSTMVGLSEHIIQPSSNPYPSAIDANWVSTPKFIFLLKVRFTDPLELDRNFYLFGYTEYNGISHEGHIDLKLRHFVNNIIETSLLSYATPTGIIQRETIKSITDVTINSGIADNLYLQRPRDIISKIEINKLATGLLNSNTDYFKGHDMTSVLSRYDPKANTSKVDNNIPSIFLAKVLDAGIKAEKSNSIFTNDYHVNTDSATRFVPEVSINDNRFLKTISRIEGYSFTTNSFMFESLMQLDRTIYDRFKVLNITKNIIDPLLANTPTVGEYWSSKDPVTIKAYEIIEASVAMALKFGFSKIYFTASNMITPTGDINIIITNFNSFMNLEEQSFTMLLDLFKSEYTNLVFMDYSHLNRIPIHLDVYVDILGTSKIFLQYAGYPGNWYTIPTFANSLITPVVTMDEKVLDFNSRLLESVIDDVASILPSPYETKNF